MSKKINNFSALITLVTVFFFWGFIAASNGVFIPFCKDYFSLNQFQSQLIDSAFYGAYYIGGFFLFMYSSYHKKDLINKNKNLEDYVESDTANITYLLKNLDKENVVNFKNFLSEISGGVEFDLVVINRDDNLDPGVLSKFDNVKFLDNDKT